MYILLAHPSVTNIVPIIQNEVGIFSMAIYVFCSIRLMNSR